MEKILEGPYQNMFVALNGFKVLVNLLECNNEDCMVYRKQSHYYRFATYSFDHKCNNDNLGKRLDHYTRNVPTLRNPMFVV